MKVIIVIPSDVEQTQAFKSIKDAATYIGKTPQYVSSALRNNPVFKTKDFIVIKRVILKNNPDAPDIITTNNT